MQTIGAAIFIKDGDKYDYCFREAIRSALWADEVVICVVTGDRDDTTYEACCALLSEYIDQRITVIAIDPEMWNLLKGKERLSYFSNVAIANLTTDWTWYFQADEVLHEDSIAAIREAVTRPNVEGFLCRRYNLWNDPYHYLTCPLERQPCSTHVIRLAKNGYRCVGDAESLGINGNLSQEFAEKIEIFHAGFVRKRDIMKEKVANMQDNIFETPHDSRLDEDKEFNPMRYFSREDLSPIPKPLPAMIQQWAAERLPR